MFGFKTYKNYTDEELMKHFVGGESKAFEELYNRYSKRLLHFIFKMMNNNEPLSQDILQEVFMKVVERPELFDANRSFKSWIFMVAANRCRNEYRKHHPLDAEFDEFQYDTNEQHYRSLIAQIDQTIFKKQLKVELNKLIYEHKSVFILRYRENFSVKEIASVLDCSEGTVKSRIHHAVKKLAERLQQFHPQKMN